MGCRLWGRTESDTTEVTQQQQQQQQQQQSSLGQADPLCQSGYCDSPFMVAAARSREDFLLVPLAHYGLTGALLRGSSHS